RVKLRAREATSGAGAVSSDVLQLGDLRLDLRTRIGTVATHPAPRTGAAGGSGGRAAAGGGPAADERSVALSSRVCTVPPVFLENLGLVLARARLVAEVGGYDYEGASSVVVVYVGFLRPTVGAKRLVTVRGAGYRMVAPAAWPGAS